MDESETGSMNKETSSLLLERYSSLFSDEARKELQEISRLLRLTRERLEKLRNFNTFLAPRLTILQNHGKQFRPFLFFLLSRFYFRKTNQKVPEDGLISLATAFELFHMFTLVHDDIIDESSLRRGAPTVFSEFGSSEAILVGDHLNLQAYDFIVRSADRENTFLSSERTLYRLSLLRECGDTLISGQFRDMSSHLHDSLTVQQYLTTIYQKTGVMFEYIVRFIFPSNDDDFDTLIEMAKKLGFLFQIRDDMIDFLDSSKTDKTQGLDLVKGTKTLPVIFFNEETSVSDQDRKEFQQIISRSSKMSVDHRIERASEIFEKYDIIEKIQNWLFTQSELYMNEVRNISEDTTIQEILLCVGKTTISRTR